MVKKVFKVRFEGIHVGPWISVTKKVPGHAFSVAFEEEEIVWILEQLKKAVELSESWGRSRTHLVEICFNNRGRYIRISKFVTNKKSFSLIVLESVKGRGWDALWKSILFVSVNPFHLVMRIEVEAKVKNKDWGLRK